MSTVTVDLPSVLTGDEVDSLPDQMFADWATQVARMAMMVPADKVASLVRELDTHVNTLMPVLDPTEWRDNHVRHELTVRFLRAFADYRRELEAIRDEAEKQMAARAEGTPL